MAIDITLQVKLSVEEQDLEDAMAEFDEIDVGKLVAQILDKSIALESINAEVTSGPATLDEYDQNS
jgi:hypothetical protein